MKTWHIVILIILVVYISGVIYASAQNKKTDALFQSDATPAGAIITRGSIWASWFGLSKIAPPTQS